ncbi:MAG: hypothetical protein JNK86_04455 [Alphaproteobacteria bacterium]|nr:hypothetical protein [Alphaproteobacteria bacterium]
MKRLMLIGSLIAVVTGCTPAITSICPPIQVYSNEFNNQLANEVKKLPDNSLILRVLSDYISLRDQLRVCLS